MNKKNASGVFMMKLNLYRDILMLSILCECFMKKRKKQKQKTKNFSDSSR